MMMGRTSLFRGTFYEGYKYFMEYRMLGLVDNDGMNDCSINIGILYGNKLQNEIESSLLTRIEVFLIHVMIFIRMI